MNVSEFQIEVGENKWRRKEEKKDYCLFFCFFSSSSPSPTYITHNVKTKKKKRFKAKKKKQQQKVNKQNEIGALIINKSNKNQHVMLCRLLHFVTCTNKRISAFRCKSYGNKVNESFSTFIFLPFRTVHTVHYFSFTSKPVFIKCITIGNENAFATRLHVMSFKTCFSYVLKDIKPWFQCVISLYVCTLCMHLRAFVFVICDLFSYTGLTFLCLCRVPPHAIAKIISIDSLVSLCFGQFNISTEFELRVHEHRKRTATSIAIRYI